ncbi:hypothetical protein ACK389_10680 [Streptomyces antibioticus]|uniref:hypothetical protein n=1 Tax=Streptomyces TaxID=1883 RepID=UPI0016731B8D|nr:hypothetical protein [Streptomyces tanashiensis]GGT22114.1 hypothetical protein GCM10010222_75010 [Streptomyces tanashiensis]
MRVRVVSILSLTAVTALSIPACSTASHNPTASPSAPVAPTSARAGGEALLPSAALEPLLLDEDDLGSDYTRKNEQPTRYDDVTVLGCPALDELGGMAATGGSLALPHKAKASFTYAGGGSEVSEELYSDSADKLSDSIGRIIDAMTGCPEYQVLTGSTAIDITTRKAAAPQLGDEQWSQLLTFSVGGRSTVVKQTAVRTGAVLLIVSGSPALVDRHLGKAHAKMSAPR